ncbi:MAG: type II CAAX endopeptidase family protein [Erysipelotrichaceae bacterium]|nr:type II CAAX endopeptidase family protein [Erysipelotrichaceae bacterium]
MTAKREHKVSKKTARRDFTTVGAFLIVYSLIVLIIPYFLRSFLALTSPEIVSDNLFYYGIYFIIILFGTLLPFFMMRKYAKLPFKKFNHGSSISFVEIMVQTIVFFTASLVLTYLSNIVFTRFGLGDKLIAGIGFSYEGNNLNNWLYVFMLVLVSPILEEYAFRGVLMHTLSKYGKLFGLIASSIIFALAHVNFAEMLPAFAMGYLLGGITLRYKSIRPTIIIHILFNLFIYGLCILPSSIAQYMAYGLVAVFVLSLYFIVSGKFQGVQIVTLRNSRITNTLFYTSWTVVLAMILMIVSTCLRTFVAL